VAHQPTSGGTVYGPGYNGRFLTPEVVREAPLRRRGLLRRWYAAREVRRLLDLLAVDLENRMAYEDGLQRTIQQLRQENEEVKLGLRQWQTDVAREAWAAEHQG
jgi:hypothetical protein